MQRWTIPNGERRAHVCDYEFSADWSLAWRVVAGPLQGQVGRCRQFLVQDVRPDVFLLWFAATPRTTITTTVDFRHRTLLGFTGDAMETRPFTGGFVVL